MLPALNDSPTLIVPLTLGDDGAVRISGSRITLEVLLGFVRQGLSPNEIAADVFDTLTVADIHAVLAWVHRHTDEVDAYLADSKRRSSEHEERARRSESPGIQRLRRMSQERS